MGPISTPTAEELDVWTFSNDHAMELMALGGFLGAFHVLTPDHLSALSALSVGGSWRSFALGVRWSMGHSGGLLIVTFVFLMLKGDLDLRLFGKYCDSMVGMFMIFIGFYGILGSLKTYTYKKQKRKDIEMRDIENDSANKHEKSSLHPSHSSDKVNMSSEIDEQEGMNTASEEKDYLIHNQHSHHDFEGLGISESLAWIPFIDMEDPVTQKVLSVAMGLLHGVAGPGGILGVLPAVEMQHWQSSTLYLGTFIITSTLSMGLFAACYGEFTRRLGTSGETVELFLRVFSSAMSVLVGAVWIGLTFFGKMEYIYGTAVTASDGGGGGSERNELGEGEMVVA